MTSQAQDSEVEEVMDQTVEDDSQEEEDETYIEALTRNVASEQDDRIVEYVENPETPEELSKNASIRKFLVQKVRDKLLASFESQLKWIDDVDLVGMIKKWKRVTSTDADVDASTAMKRIIKDNDVINEAVVQHLEELMESEDDEEV